MIKKIKKFIWWLKALYLIVLMEVFNVDNNYVFNLEEKIIKKGKELFNDFEE